MDEYDGEIKLDPICELFRNGDPEFRSISTLGRIWVPASCGLIGFLGVSMHNIVNKRPFLSGLQRYAIYGIVGTLVGIYLERKRHVVLSERDLQYYHYMTLHPQDFAAPERIKYKDFLGPWIPIR